MPNRLPETLVSINQKLECVRYKIFICMHQIHTRWAGAGHGAEPLQLEFRHHARVQAETRSRSANDHQEVTRGGPDRWADECQTLKESNIASESLASAYLE
jgi:hypothetical protein